MQYKNRSLTQKELHTLFTSYYQELCRFADYIVNCTDTADDLVQRSFIRLWEKRDQVHINKDIKSYLYKSVKNASLNYLKQFETRKNYEKEFSELSQTNDFSGFDEILFRKKLELAIALLPERCRMAYCLKYIEGLNYKEIADYLEISTNTVDNHIQKALKLLKELLGKYKEDFYNN